MPSVPGLYETDARRNVLGDFIVKCVVQFIAVFNRERASFSGVFVQYYVWEMRRSITVSP